MPTISDGLAGLIDCVFSAVFRWRPPITRSYSRPSSLRTFSMAARIRRAVLEPPAVGPARLKLGADHRVARGQVRAKDVESPRVEGCDGQVTCQLFRHGDDHTGRGPTRDLPPTRTARMSHRSQACHRGRECAAGT